MKGFRLIGLLAGSTVLLSATSFAATTQCPNLSVVVTGTSSLAPGFTYQDTMELHKVGPGKGYDGKWRVARWEMINTYPHRTDAPPIGPLVVPAQPQFGGGMTMTCVGRTIGNRAVNTCTGGNLTFNVSGGRMGPAAHPIGHIQGKTMTIRFDPNNPMEPLRTGTIQDFPGGKLSLSITAPTAGVRVVFDSQNPGQLQLKLRAQVTPAQYANQVTWDIPEIAGSQKQAGPTQGDQVDVTYSGLPSLNNAFGKKTVSASVDVGNCQVSESADFQVFYPRDASNHPGSDKTPNWFHYWSQTQAKVGPAKFGGNSGRCGSGGDYGKLMGYYRNKILDSVYYICDLKSFGPDFSFKTVKWDGALPENREVTGIDTFAVVSRHENAHYEHFTQWWKGEHTQNKFEDTNQNGVKDSAEQKLDQDGDEVPDTLEPGYGMNPKKKQTLGAGVPDEELICWKAEAAWQPGSADAEDWAKPGKQWK